MDYSWNSNLSRPRHGSSATPPTSSPPVYANFASEKLTIGAGVAIFHVASARVVVCQHKGYHFLPKGRRNADEDTGSAAEREGFEESGYRNRLLPLPLVHRQPDPDDGHVDFVVEPIWTQMLPQSATAQYVLFWYAAETVPVEIEQSYQDATSGTSAPIVYRPPLPFPPTLTLRERIASEEIVDGNVKKIIYQPVKHEGTGVNEEEQAYKSFLLPIDEARRKLRGSIMEDVVRRGWEAIVLRQEIENRAT